VFQPLLTYSAHSVLHRFVSVAVTEKMSGISGFIALILDESNICLHLAFKLTVWPVVKKNNGLRNTVVSLYR